MVYAAFLRAVNVGSHNRIRMDELRALVAGLGYGDVRTHLQTGNLAFEAGRAGRETVAQGLEAALAARLAGVDVIVRSRAELGRLVQADPFAPHPAESYYRYVVLTRTPVVAPELPFELGGVSFVAAAPGVLLGIHPKPSPRSPNANAVVESQWKVRATTRFWNVLEDFVAGPLAAVGDAAAGGSAGAA